MSPNFYLVCIGVSLFASVLFWGIKNKPQIKNHGVILAILFLVFLMEITGDYTASRSINNSLLYNIGWVYLESVLLIFYFYTLEIDALVKKKIRLITISMMTWGLGNTLFFQDITSTFQFFSFLPFAIAIIILSVHFLSKILNLKIFAERNILSVPHFWIVCALLFFYCEAVLLFGTYQFYPKPIIENVALLFNFNRLLAGIMYLTFGLSFFIPFFISKRNSNAF
ncbi:hypothetical protein [Belliella aquatica]|uniref:Histidine kinase N-terminal 7TM region domain-containing protein n=1 Tax=Belliella aquatica TaxID=1323734 RepID=A0ABQ1MLI3_9BACT|nr:hypothetical protein [Belliella aquatica]MCH7405492.1 hypothetical protein [Belliella aquatica]GGC41134.1 hypothetical protein GCM10010993_19740 [Belliella aquatica]